MNIGKKCYPEKNKVAAAAAGSAAVFHHQCQEGNRESFAKNAPAFRLLHLGRCPVNCAREMDGWLGGGRPVSEDVWGNTNAKLS